MNFRPAIAALSLTLALGACGELPFGQSETAPEAPGHSGPPTVSPVDQPIETGGEGKAVSTAEASTMNTAIFRAVGTEPFWAVTAGSDTAVYERPGQRSVGVSVRRITYGRGVEFIGVMNGRPFTLNLQAATCSDGMSDTKYPFTARLSAGGQRLTGCAGPTDTMPKAQVRARSDAPATTPRRATPAPAPTPTPAPTAGQSTTSEGTANEGTATETTTNPSSVTAPTTTTSPSTNSGTTSGSTTSEATLPSSSGAATTGAGSDSSTPESGATQGGSSTGSSSTGSSSTGTATSTGSSTGTGTGTGTTQSTGGAASETTSGSTTGTTAIIPPSSEDTAD